MSELNPIEDESAEIQDEAKRRERQTAILVAAADQRLGELQQEAAVHSEEDWEALYTAMRETLEKIVAVPFVQNSLQCQRLIRRLAGADSIETFVERVEDFDLYVRQVVAATREEEVPTEKGRPISNTTSASRLNDRPSHLAEDDEESSRTRLQL
ncbi:MAG: hypothetical protein AAGE61_17270 [Pseudomonadota bacterium]